MKAMGIFGVTGNHAGATETAKGRPPRWLVALAASPEPNQQDRE